MSVTELVKKHNLYSEVADLIQEYHRQVAPITEKYRDVLSLDEIPEDSTAYVLFLGELWKEWQKLGNQIRKMVRKIDKEGE